MRRHLNHAAMPAVGFVEPWSLRAGERAQAFLSCTDPHAGIRIVSLDRDETEILPWTVERLGGAFEIRPYDLGSWIEFPEEARVNGDRWRIRFEFLLTRNDSVKYLFAAGALGITVNEGGDLAIVGGDDPVELGTLRNEVWSILTVSASASAVEVAIESAEGLVGKASLRRFPRLHGMPVSIGSNGATDIRTLNCRIGRIDVDNGEARYEWRFPTKGPVTGVDPLGDQPGRLALHNMPTFVVASPRFNGEIHDPRLDPGHFDAIHLHDDDFGGFDWPADLRIDVPEDARSGVYAVEVTTGTGVEKLPFFVRPKSPASPLAFLLPTNTYLAYADERLPPARYPWHGWDRGHQFSVDNEFLCLYDVHTDLSGVSLTSARRPRATLRDDYHYPLSDCPHLLPVDLQLLKFYARNGIDIDVLTDRDLHDFGSEAVSPYSGLLTGSHPEYWSTPMMKALDAFLAGGGNLAYLGGNGFYWVVAHQDQTMELRRVKSDIWTGRPGEAHMSITGEPGGNWEDRGLRNPQSYLGVTYLIMSFGPARPYTRLEASHDGEYSWLFDRVAGDSFGDSGTVLGGAAGYEIDAIVRSEETPANLVRLAVADGFDSSFQVRPEVWLADGDAERETLRRADMTAYRHRGGGIVFCTGSVAWLGALPGPGTGNDVGQIMINLAKGFARS